MPTEGGFHPRRPREQPPDLGWTPRLLEPISPRCKQSLRPRKAMQPLLAMELAREHQLEDRTGREAAEAEAMTGTGHKRVRLATERSVAEFVPLA